jgi:hypothetical protein
VMQVKTEFLGHSIIVSNAFGHDAKLYVDGKVVDTSKAGSRSRAFLVGAITEDGKTHLIEVFLGGSIFRKKLIICIDGKEVACGR